MVRCSATLQPPEMDAASAWLLGDDLWCGREMGHHGPHLVGPAAGDISHIQSAAWLEGHAAGRDYQGDGWSTRSQRRQPIRAGRCMMGSAKPVTYQEASAALSTFREWESIASDIDGIWAILTTDRESQAGA